MSVALPGAVQAELLFALALGYWRGEFHAIEPWGCFQRGDECARRPRLSDQFHSLGVHAERLEPRILRQKTREIAKERQRADALRLHAPDGGQDLLPPVHVGGETLHGL